MDLPGDGSGGLFAGCFTTTWAWIRWCATCGREHSYSQAFLDERSEAMSTSVTSSPYQTPVQATSSGLSGNERTSLLPKATELHPTNTGAARHGEKPAKEGKEEQMAMLSAPAKELKQVSGAVKHSKSGLSLANSDDEEFCPTCLEPYTKDNPAIWTKCNHHFHLACIYEWLERKQTCPLCERIMSFEEILE